MSVRIDYEAAAERLYSDEVGTEMPNWVDLPDEDKDIFRMAARDVVDAALPDGDLWVKQPCPVCLDSHGEWLISICGTCDSRGYMLVKAERGNP